MQGNNGAGEVEARPVAETQPVAWRYRQSDKAVWQYGEDRVHIMGWEINPLYSLATVEALRSERDALREALKPFAKASDALVAGIPENISLGIHANGAMMFGPDFPNIGDLNRARAALSVAPATASSTAVPLEWQSIETAPLDATHVIIAVPTKDRDDYIVGEAYFNADHGGWWWSGTDYGDYFGGPVAEVNWHAPTHWMPLPSPPALASTGDRT